MKDPIMDVCDIVRETSYSIHRYLRSGHLEKVYENSLAHRLRKKAITLEQQYPIEVYDEDGTPLGHFVTDLLVEGHLIVELKACSTLVPEHTAQILGYLRGSKAPPWPANKLWSAQTSNQEINLVNFVPFCG